VGELSCDDAEGGSSANCPLSVFTVFDSHSELERATAEDLPMCEAGVSSDFPLSVEDSRSSEVEGASGNGYTRRHRFRLRFRPKRADRWQFTSVVHLPARRLRMSALALVRAMTDAGACLAGQYRA